MVGTDDKMGANQPAQYSRRSLLRRSLGAAAGLSLASLGIRQAWADDADCGPTGWAPRFSEALGDDNREYKILEVYLYGGVSPWETFAIRESVNANWQGWWGEKANLAGIPWDCAGNVDLDQALHVNDDFRDQSGNLVELGPCTEPLFRPFGPPGAEVRLVDRLRLVTARHNLLPHEAAIPMAQCGLRLGNPRRAGIGTPIQRRARSTQPGCGNPPLSFVLFPEGRLTSGDNVGACLSTGLHSAAFRPLDLFVGANGSGLYDWLGRPGRPADEDLASSRDSVLRGYANRYRQALKRDAMASPGRSVGELVYQSGLQRLFDAGDIRNRIDQTLLGSEVGTACLQPTSGGSPGTHTLSQLRQAAHLLRTPNPEQGARYVSVIDGGIFRTDGAGYDTHVGNRFITQNNLWWTLNEIQNLVQDGSIDLDTTMILLNTEFGRTPHRGSSPTGRDHWPEGYMLAMLGGPVRQGVSGALDEGARANVNIQRGAYSPTDVLAATLLAAGINPVNVDVYSEADLSPAIKAGADTPDELQRNLAEQVLGLV